MSNCLFRTVPALLLLVIGLPDEWAGWRPRACAALQRENCRRRKVHQRFAEGQSCPAAILDNLVPYCRREQPLVDRLDQEFRDRGLVVLAVDVNESKKTVKKYWSRVRGAAASF